MAESRAKWSALSAVAAAMVLAVVLLGLVRLSFPIVASVVDAEQVSTYVTGQGGSAGSAVAGFALAVLVFAAPPLAAFWLWWADRRRTARSWWRFAPIAILVAILIPVLWASVHSIRRLVIEGGEMLRVPDYFTDWFTSFAVPSVGVAHAKVVGAAMAGAILAGWVLLGAVILIGTFVPRGKERTDRLFSPAIALACSLAALGIAVLGGWIVLA